MSSSSIGRTGMAVRALVLAAFAALVLVASTASAEEGPVGPGGPPPCAPGQLPSQQAPCQPPPCAEGQQPTQQAPCITPGHITPGPGGPGGGQPCGPGPGPGPDAGPGPGEPRVAGPRPGPGEPPQQGPGGPPEGGPQGHCGGAPRLNPSFLSRVWRLTAEADSYDTAGNVLNVTITKMLNVPRAFRSQDDEIVDQDAYVLFTAKTKVFDRNGRRLSRERAYDNALDNADSVTIAGKLVKPSKWEKDEDDNPVTTIRAKRVTITG